MHRPHRVARAVAVPAPAIFGVEWLAGALALAALLAALLRG